MKVLLSVVVGDFFIFSITPHPTPSTAQLDRRDSDATRQRLYSDTSWMFR